MSLAAPSRADTDLSPEPDAPVPRTRLPLAAKLAIYTALIVVIAAAALGVAAYGYAREALKSRVRDRLEQVATDRRTMILGYLGQQRQLAAMIAKRTFLRGLLENYLAGQD